jgi:hypothetical protein
LNVEYRIRLRRKQQKFLKKIRQVFYFDILSAAGGFCGSAVRSLEAF